MESSFFKLLWQKYHKLTRALGVGLCLGLSGAAAHAADIRISQSDCRWLETYKEGGADYRPGMDVNGNPVPPADLGAPPIELSPDIVISLNADLAEDYGIGPASPLLETEAHLGLITVKGNAVYFNGRLIGDPERAALADRCHAVAEPEG